MAGVGKKLVNDPSNCVAESLAGLVSVHTSLRLLEGLNVVVRADIDKVKAAGKVTLVSGGGSGHEPTHAGYIGVGMLSAIVAGAVFTSPPPSAILAAIRAVGRGNKAGTLLIVKNYTGDRLNFGLAAERAKAEGLKVDMVVIGDDCALTSSDKTAGRRGLAGTILVHKIAGAMAEEGRTLEEIGSVVKGFIGNLGTIGLSLSPCSVPGSGPSFTLPDDQMELGLGIHGEAGVRRIKLLPAKEAVATMLEHMTDPNSSTHFNLKKGSSVALVVNNLGGTSLLEMGIVTKEAIAWIESRGASVDRAYSGHIITALEMAGVSLSLLLLTDNITKYLDAVTSAPGWSQPVLESGATCRVTPSCMPCPEDTASTTTAPSGKKLDTAGAATLSQALQNLSQALIDSETELNELDKASGDADCGNTHTRGAKAISSKLGSADAPGLPVAYPHSLALALAALVEQDMGGSSGALYSLFLAAAAGPLANDISPKGICTALETGIQAMTRYGGAGPGYRTMLDALYPAHKALAEAVDTKPAIEAFRLAAEAAESGAASTVAMAAHAGRASYVSSDNLHQRDPGAQAVAIWMMAAYQTYKNAA